MPPCILQTRIPFTAGERHDLPARVVALQRGAFASSIGSRCMGLAGILGGSPCKVDVLMMVDMLFVSDGDFLAG